MVVFWQIPLTKSAATEGPVVPSTPPLLLLQLRQAWNENPELRRLSSGNAPGADGEQRALQFLWDAALFRQVALRLASFKA